MRPKYIQFNCREAVGLDLRQANAVLKHKPDIIILEYPNNSKTPELKFKQRPKKFPKEVLKIHLWAKADEIMWKNIADLRSKGQQIKIYAIDAPNELTKEWLEAWRHMYSCANKNWLWWVKIYLRERIMANNIRWALNHYEEKHDPVVLIFLQKFHWDHVKFLLDNPTKNEIWNYYFGGFSEINRRNIKAGIKHLNKVFYKYWKRVSDF